jgi:hypothetical protein
MQGIALLVEVRRPSGALRLAQTRSEAAIPGDVAREAQSAEWLAERGGFELARPLFEPPLRSQAF